MKRLLEEITEYPEVLKYLEHTYDDPQMIKNMKRGIWILGWLFKNYRKEIRECEERYFRMKSNKMILHLKGKYSQISFYLPLLQLENHRIRGEYIQRMIFKSENFFDIGDLEWLRKNKILRKGMNILDIGANIGNHTIYFAKICNAGHVYSFEPVRDTYKMLCKNCRINGLDQVSLYNFALGRKQTSVQIKSFNEKNYGGTVLQYCKGGGIACCALDELIMDPEAGKKMEEKTEEKIEKKIDFIKIDVEGFENEILLGGAELIKRDQPVIFVEIFEENVNTVDKTMKKLGYEMKESRSGDYLYLPRQEEKR